MSEEFKSEYKIFEDINLENNKIINVSEISSYDGNTGKYNSDVNNSGLYIHTPGNPTTVSKPNNDKGLIITTGHAQTYLDKVDNVLIMSVEPGKGGQKFMDSVVYKIDILDKIRKNKKLNYKISIDGGINKDTIDKVRNVDLVISGSYICMSDNYQDKIDSLRSHYEK